MNNGDNSGAIPERIKVNMTQPRDWPVKAKEARDQAAERMSEAEKIVAGVMVDPRIPHDLLVNLIKANRHQAKAIEWFLVMDAEIRPEIL